MLSKETKEFVNKAYQTDINKLIASYSYGERLLIAADLKYASIDLLASLGHISDEPEEKPSLDA